MAINDFIKDLLSNKKTPISNLQLPLVQINEQGGLETDPLKMAQAELGLKQASTPLTVKDKLFGREMTQDYQTFNPDTNQAEIGTLTNYKPGFFNDFTSGFKENYTQGFDVNNLAPQNKGLATRIGEGLGTLARFYDKPIGRMAVATGLSYLTGEQNPLQEGVKAYVGRQTNLTKDKAYRQGLINMGIDEAQVNDIPGIITDDVFKNYALANYRNNMTNYRNLKLDKDTYIKQQQNIYKMLNDGVITAEEATKQMQLLNDEYQKQNPMDMQESNKTVQGNRRLDIMQQNADTYANNTGKIKTEDTDEYKQDLADYVMLAKDPRKRNKLAKFEAIFAQKYGKLPPKVQ